MAPTAHRRARRAGLTGRTLAAAFSLLSVLSGGRAAAQRCPTETEAIEALSTRPSSERAAFLLASAREAHGHASTWSATFATGYLVIGAGQLGLLAYAENDGQRANRAIAAISSLIGVATLLGLPLDVLARGEAIEEVGRAALAGDCEALAELERLIAASAASEQFGTSWLIHAGGVVFNLVIGLLVGLASGDWLNAAISAGVGIAIGELQILTQPMTTTNALARYRAGELDAPAGAEPIVVTAPLDLSSGFGGGLAVGASF